MSKLFKFDAIGRDLLPGERQAARAFVSKYESPPSRADAQREMRTVMGRVLKAAVQISGTATVKAAPAVFDGQQKKTVSGKVIEVRAKRAIEDDASTKKVKVGIKAPGAPQLIVRGSVRRAAKG